jgi:DNA invertase Pin-like site-specific DNA recombinase
LQILSYVAQTEREFIHQRQAEGIAAAKANGVKFGRPKLPESSDFNKACLKYKSGELSLKEAARACNMPSSTFYAKIKRIESVK